MSQETRQKALCELIARCGECSIEELVEQFAVSGMTIRRDLQALADRGKVIRTHGGAAMAERVSFEFEFLSRVREHQAAKEAIAATAAAQVNDGESVILDSGTTTLELAKRLRGKRGLTVITSSLPNAAQLQFDQQIEVLLLGGRLRPSSPDLAGALTEANLETLRGRRGVSGRRRHRPPGRRLSRIAGVGPHVDEDGLLGGRVFVVADGSKLGKTALWRFGRLTDWAALVTDATADRAVLASLKKAGVRVIRAD